MSRAFAQGMITGFLKSNNERRATMQQRLHDMAKNNATFARERAKSRYDSALKAAQEEESRFQALRSEGMVSEDGSYTPVYWRDKARQHWMDEGQRGTLEEYAKEYMQGRGSKFQRQYKSPSELQGDLSNLYAGINATEYEEMGRNAMTGFDQILGRGVIKLADTVQAGVNAGAEFMGVDARMQHTMTPDQLESGTPSAMPQMQGIHAVQGPIETNEVTGYRAPMAPKEPTYTPYRNAIEAETGEVLGNVFTIQDETGMWNGQLQRDGSYKRVNVTARPTTEEGEKTRDISPKLNKVQEEGLVRYDRHERVSNLATELAKNDYKGNPVAFVQRNLSVLKDIAGASVGMTGDHDADLEAITNFLNEKVTKEGLQDKLGTLDAAAVIKGDIEATTKFLVYATANMFHEGDRITVAAKETAESVIDSLIFGTATHDARLMSLATKAQDEMSRVTMTNLSSIRKEPEHPLWNYYPNVKEHVDLGASMVTSVSSGMALADRINGMKSKDPNAYQKTINSLTKRVGSNDTSILENPVFVHPKLGTPVVVMYKENQDGALDFRLVPIK